MKMKRFFILSLMALMTISSTADTLTIRQPFIEMPDSLIPYLSHNSRLDFLDFMDSKMKAEIINEFGGKSMMITLGEDSLTIRMNDACTLELLLLTTTELVDGCNHVISMIKTVGVDDGYQESTVQYFTIHWKPLSDIPKLIPEHRKRLDSYAKPLRILNFFDRKLNNN